MPLTRPNFSCRTLTIGAKQLVVHEALEMISWSAWMAPSLTPITTVMSAPLAGAEMTTFLAPASIWARALSASVKNPVDSSTTSTPKSPQGRLAGSRSAKMRIALPLTTKSSPATSISPAKRPWVESYLSRWASVLASVRSLMALISSPPCSTAALNTKRPIRPKPLIATGNSPISQCVPSCKR